MNAILLVRTRRHAAEADSFFREQINALTADVDRANALLLSEPQIVVAWAAASDEPDIIGDIAIVTSATMPQRVLAFGWWLPADQAHAMERAVDALRDERRKLRDGADHDSPAIRSRPKAAPSADAR